MGQNGQQRDPDAIQKEIEQTRAELAETIDAIADRISPKRAAARSAQAVKSQVSAVFGGANGDVPASVPDSTAATATEIDTEQRRRSVEAVSRAGAGTAYPGTGTYAVSRRLRLDRVFLVTGLLAAIAGAVILWRSRD